MLKDQSNMSFVKIKYKSDYKYRKTYGLINYTSDILLDFGIYYKLILICCFINFKSTVISAEREFHFIYNSVILKNHIP